MSLIKRTAEQLIIRILRAREVPEQQWPELIKKTGRGMILLGVLMVVPLLLIEKVALPVTIAMQICYASLICVGVLLAFDEKKSKGRS